MIEILYYAFIFPLQSVLGFALESLFGAIKSYGLSIIFLSLIINLILLKLSKIAEAKAHKTNALKARCDSKIAEFKRVFKGAELQSYIRTLYKQRHYHPIFALSALGGLALQVPFFIAILFLLQDFEGIKGESFLWISDLSAPDLILGVHILPILMTIISLTNVWIVAKDRGARIQGIIIALIFFVLLYRMPSALVLYWTTNMAFSLIRAICNSSLTRPSREFEKSSFDRPSVLSHSDFPTQPTNLAQDTRIADLKKSSLRVLLANPSSRSDSWQSKNSPSLAEGVRGWVKSFFIFRKPLKIAVITLTAILAIGLCATFSLMIYAKDNVQTAPLTFDTDSKARIHFGKWDFLLRSSSISNVKLVDIAWDKAIDSTDIKVIRNAKRFVYFEYLDLEKGTNLGQISYIMNFTPLMQNLFRYYFAILGSLLGIYLLICVILRFQAYHESYAQTYRKVANYAILCIAFLICVFTPYQLYNTDITQFDSSQTFATLSALFGAFVLVSFVVIYAISFIPKRFSNFVAFILSLILFSGIVYSFILVGDYGAMDHFILQKAPESSIIQIFEFIAVLTLGIALVAFGLKKLICIWQIVLLTLFVVSGVNAFQIIDKRIDSAKVAQESQNNDKSKPPYENELFSYSKTDKNIVILVLDMFSGSHTPYILEQFPQFKTELDGFTLFPNALSTTEATMHSVATLIGGEYYSAYNMNKRKNNLRQSIDMAYIDIGNAFASSGFSVSLMAHAGTTISNITKTNDEIFGISAWEDDFTYYYIYNNPDSLENIIKAKVMAVSDIYTHFLGFGLFKFASKIFRAKIYKNGLWLQVNSKTADTLLSIKSTSSVYAIANILNTTSNKPTFKFFHTDMTHFPCVMYFDGNKCDFFSNKSAWNDYPHKAKIPPIANFGQSFYQHYDAESCALKYLTNYISLLKRNGIYDNTQIFVVSDHAGEDSIEIPKFKNNSSNRWMDILLLFKDFGAKGDLRIDNRLMANYDISSIFCENLSHGCSNVPKNILKHYPTNRAIVSTIPISFDPKKHKPNQWIIEKAYKVRDNIYDSNNWIDISDESYGIVNIKEYN